MKLDILGALEHQCTLQAYDKDQKKTSKTLSVYCRVSRKIIEAVLFTGMGEPM